MRVKSIRIPDEIDRAIEYVLRPEGSWPLAWSDPEERFVKL